MSKYFILEDKKLAEVMQILLEEGYCTFSDNDGVERYTFKRRSDINRIYGKAKTILELI